MRLVELIKELKRIKKRLADNAGEYMELHEDSRGRETLESKDPKRAEELIEEAKKLKKEKQAVQAEIRRYSKFASEELAKALVSELDKRRKSYNLTLVKGGKSGKVKLVYVRPNKQKGNGYFIGVEGKDRGLLDRDIEIEQNNFLPCVCFVPPVDYKAINEVDIKRDKEIGDEINAVYLNLIDQTEIVDGDTTTV